MNLRYDEDLVEAAVVLSTTRRRQAVPVLQIARFHRERETLYSILDPDERNRAFFRLHLDWFREWGLEGLLIECLPEFPLLQRSLDLLAFRQARGKHDEGSELYVNESGQRHGVVALRPERLARPTELTAFLRHELMHLHDMVDPAFGYRPELSVPGVSLGQHRLARERYRLLWDVTIDGRLTQSGRPTIATREQRWTEFASAFGFWAEQKQQETFEVLWAALTPSHRVLAEYVRDPRDLRGAARPYPGAPCPLCGFPTFVWAEPSRWQDEAVAAVRADFPHWAPEQGACGRCEEMYRYQGPCPVQFG